MLQVLYKLKTAKVFERARGKEEKPSTDIVEEDPFAIQTLSWCPESRMLCVAGVSAHVIVYRFSKQEVTTEVVQVCGRNNLCTPCPVSEITSFIVTSSLGLCSFWRCGCSASLATETLLIQEGSRPPHRPPRELPRALRRAILSLSHPQAASPPTDPGTTYPACSMSIHYFWDQLFKKTDGNKVI